MSNVLSEEKRQQVIALGRLGWPLRRIEQETGVRRETAGSYLKAAGIAVRSPGGWGRRPPAKPANEVTTGSGVAKPVIAVHPNLNPENLSNKGKATSKPANEVTTGWDVEGRGPEAESSQPIPSTSFCEPYREAIELGLSRGRNAMAIWQDLVSDSGFRGGYQTVKRFVRKVARKPATPAARGDCHRAGRRGSSRLRPGTDDPRAPERKISTHPTVRDDARLQPQSGTLPDFPFQFAHLGRTTRESLPSLRWQHARGRA